MELDQPTLIALLFTGTCFVFVVGAILMPTRQEKTGKRASAVVDNSYSRTISAGGKVEGGKDRRKIVQDKLKKLEQRQAAAASARKITLDQRLERANLNISVQSFLIGSLAVGVIFSVLAALFQQDIMIVVAVFVTTAFGVPRWILFMITKRRQKKFLADFPGAIDIVIRGVRSGLPVNECLKVISRDMPAPIGDEFHQFTEGMRVGMTLEQGVEKMYERIPLQEVSFFGIVLVVQKQTGGNLGEALNNLSTVIRSRKSMLGKINALSMEAKASAVILGSMPIVVGVVINLLNPQHLAPLFDTSIGHFLLLGSAIWMSLGIFVMKKMCAINV